MLTVVTQIQKKRPDITNYSYFCQGCGINPAYTALLAAGIEVVAAIGNYGPYCLSAVEPGGYSNIISAGALFGSSNLITDFSSRGPYVDINDNLFTKPELAAPGASVTSSYIGNGTRGYIMMAGTSMASPHVAGSIALLWSKINHFKENRLKGKINETRRLLYRAATFQNDTSCNFPGFPFTPQQNNVYGYGVLNVFKAYLESLRHHRYRRGYRRHGRRNNRRNRRNDRY